MHNQDFDDLINSIKLPKKVTLMKRRIIRWITWNCMSFNVSCSTISFLSFVEDKFMFRGLVFVFLLCSVTMKLNLNTNYLFVLLETRSYISATDTMGINFRASRLKINKTLVCCYGSITAFNLTLPIWFKLCALEAVKMGLNGRRV